jgi:hypothetical protein
VAVLSAPYRREPDGLALDVQGTILNVAPDLVLISVLGYVKVSVKLQLCDGICVWSCIGSVSGHALVSVSAMHWYLPGNVTVSVPGYVKVPLSG